MQGFSGFSLRLTNQQSSAKPVWLRISFGSIGSKTLALT
jgi:hypothetical protein